MYVISLVNRIGDKVAPALEKGVVYKVVGVDDLHFFLRSDSEYSRSQKFGFFKNKFKILNGNEQVIKLLYEGGK